MVPPSQLPNRGYVYPPGELYSKSLTGVTVNKEAHAPERASLTLSSVTSSGEESSFPTGVTINKEAHAPESPPVWCAKGTPP